MKSHVPQEIIVEIKILIALHIRTLWYISFRGLVVSIGQIRKKIKHLYNVINVEKPALLSNNSFFLFIVSQYTVPAYMP